MTITQKAAVLSLALLTTLGIPAQGEDWRFLPEHSTIEKYAMSIGQNAYVTYFLNDQLWLMQLGLIGVTSAKNASLTFDTEQGQTRRFGIDQRTIRFVPQTGVRYHLIDIILSQDMLEAMEQGGFFDLSVDGQTFRIPLDGADYTFETIAKLLAQNLEQSRASDTAKLRNKANHFQAVIDCNALTAHRWDQHRRAAAVPFAALDAGSAIAACEQALRPGQQDPRLINQLGRAYHKDGDAQALTTLQRAANDLNYPAAYYALARLYEDGTYTGKDADTARRMYLKGWSTGHIPSTFALGRIDIKSAQTTAEIAEAISLMRTAADAGYAQASYHLHQIYKAGTQIEPDPTKAQTYLRQAADQGHTQARKDLETQ